MGHGTLPNNHAQRKRHQKRPERLGNGNGETPLHFGFGIEPNNGQFGNGSDSERIADFEGWGVKYYLKTIKNNVNDDKAITKLKRNRR